MPKFPDSWTVCVYANLNDIFDANQRYVGKSPLFDSEVADMCEELQYYVAPMVIGNARSDRWNIKEKEFDAVAKDVRKHCRVAGIACKQGREFWESLRPWATLMGGQHHKDGGLKSLADNRNY